MNIEFNRRHFLVDTLAASWAVSQAAIIARPSPAKADATRDDRGGILDMYLSII